MFQNLREVDNHVFYNLVKINDWSLHVIYSEVPLWLLKVRSLLLIMCALFQDEDCDANISYGVVTPNVCYNVTSRSGTYI